jgi:UDP-N-acetylmuramoyl-tripeptide--D-alanyl-D-alanine ligase
VIPLTLADVAAMTGGRLDAAAPGARVSGPVVADSRAVAPGGLFAALPGEHADGHDFAASAVAGGAAAVLAARPVGVAAVVVDDVLGALGRLARGVLDRLPDTTVIGLTGSHGKTSTKDLLADVLAAVGPTVAPHGSYNTELGVPLTVLAADEGTRHLVVEMGARGPGHIAYLCGIARPTVGVVLNVGRAHLGEFGSREAIARAKGELVEALPASGIAVLLADDPMVRAMADRTSAAVLTFGRSPGADVAVGDVALDERARASFALRTPLGEVHVDLRLHGEHHVANAAAAAAAALACGADLDVVAEQLSAAVPRSRWRMEVVERPDGVTVVNDAYNANPDSVRAALEALVVMAGTRRSWAVLGEMRELGAASVAEHDAVGRLAAQLDVDRLVVVGEGARAVHLGAAQARSGGKESVHVPDAAAALALLRAELAPGDVVLVKASRAAGLEVVAQALLDGAPAQGRGG